MLKDENTTLNLSEKIDLFPDYVTYVEQEFHQLIAQNEQLEKNLASPYYKTVRQNAVAALEQKVKEVLESGVIIHTALDTELQNKSQRSLQQGLPYHDVEGAIVVIQHHTHELVSLVGAKVYKKYSFHRGFQSYRQPGSTIKPLLVYAPYIGRSGASVNSKIDGSAFCANGYCPKNYGGVTVGSVSIKEAFIRSYNTPAVRLLQQNGVKESFAYLNHFDFKKVDEHDYLLPAAIGGFTYGMSPLELTAAYTSFVDGTYHKPRAFRMVTDLNGNIIYKWNDSSVQVWNANTVSKLRSLLTSVIKEGTAKSANFSSNGYIGGKTGTTNSAKDLWFIGLTIASLLEYGLERIYPRILNILVSPD